MVEKEDEENDEKKKKRESRGWAPEAGGKSINKRRSPATQLAASSHSLSFFWPDFFVLLFLLLDLLSPRPPSHLAPMYSSSCWLRSIFKLIN